MKRSIVLLAIVLGSCTSTGAQEIGRDTYLSSARSAFGGESGAKSKALATAEASCTAQGKAMKMLNMDSHECALHGGCGEAQITYMCLARNDPRY